MSLRGTTTSLWRGSHEALGKSTYEDRGGRRFGKFVPRPGTQFATSKRFMNGADLPKFIAVIGIRGVVNRLVGGQKTLAQWLRTDLRSDDHRCLWRGASQSPNHNWRASRYPAEEGFWYVPLLAPIVALNAPGLRAPRSHLTAPRSVGRPDRMGASGTAPH
jgi:hypothetical protein